MLFSRTNIGWILTQIENHHLALLSALLLWSKNKGMPLWKCHVVCQKMFEDTKEIIRSRKWKKEKTTQWSKEKGQKDKQLSTKHCIENQRLNNTMWLPRIPNVQWIMYLNMNERNAVYILTTVSVFMQ